VGKLDGGSAEVITNYLEMGPRSRVEGEIGVAERFSDLRLGIRSSVSLPLDGRDSAAKRRGY
jgi:hypothetical protein